MKENIEIIQEEAYSILQNVDESILLLNPYIETFGFKILFIELETLEKRFHKIFLENLSRNNNQLRFKSGKVINRITLTAITHYPFLGYNVLEQEGVYLVKYLKPLSKRIINKAVTLQLNELRKVKDFTESLVQQLRLFKPGDIFSGETFQIAKGKTEISQRIKVQQVIPGYSRYTLDDDEVEQIGKSLVQEFTPQDYLKLALERFYFSYKVSDQTIKFFTLNLVLETVFKKWSDNAAHNIARCSSFIVVGENGEETLEWYKKIKKLYKTRSKIAHGGDASKDIAKKINYIEFVVRKVLNYVIRADFKNLIELCNYLDEEADN